MRRTSSLVVPSIEVSRQIDNTAYETVKKVADNIELITDVAEALETDSFGIAAANVEVIQTVAGIASEIVDVANGIGDIASILAYLTEIDAVAENLGVIQAVGSNIDKVTNVYDMLDVLQRVDGNAVSITTVANGIDAIVITASSNDNIDVVATNIQNVNTVVAKMDEIDTVVEYKDNVRTVAENMIPVIWLWQNKQLIEEIASIGTGGLASVVDNIDNILTVADNVEDVVIVADSIDSVNTVAEVSNDVHIVATNIDHVVTNSNNIGSITVVGNDLTLAGYANLQDLGSIEDPVVVEPTGFSVLDTVATNIDVVGIVANSITDVESVGANIDDVISVSVNMAEVLMADENAAIATTKAGEALVSADNAADSEVKAYKWANETEDVPVQGTVGIDDEYSAYHWAKKAEAVAGGSVELGSLYDVNTTGVLDGQVLVYDNEAAANEKWKPATADKVFVGLDQVDNTSDATKWAAVATLTNKYIDDMSNFVGANHVHYEVKNQTGTEIGNGVVVSFAGAVEDEAIRVKPWETGEVAIGITHGAIAHGESGLVIVVGRADGVDTNAYGVFTILYPANGGGLTNVKPTTGYYQAVATVMKKAGGTGGSLLVNFAEPRATTSQIVEEITAIDCGSI